MTKTMSATEAEKAEQAVRRAKAAAMMEAQLGEWFEEDMHGARVKSLASAAVGAVSAGALGVHAIGHGLAYARGLTDKHAIKQVDRLLSNGKLNVWELFATWVPHVLGQRTEAIVALDWTDFDADDQSTLCMHLVSTHGRATPLVWKTVRKSELKGQRAAIENDVIARFLETAPPDIKVTVLADRGFADVALFALLEEWEADYVIRIRGNVKVTDKIGEERRADAWVPKNGHSLILREPWLTKKASPVPAVVCVRAARMREAWCLATSRSDLKSAAVVQLYGRRFTIEEAFRDIKDPRFGMGFSDARVSTPDRRDRLLLVAALAIALLTVLGAAGESLGMERGLKANTSTKRTYSLLRQGLMYYGHIPMMKEERLAPLMARFAELLAQVPVFKLALGVL